MSGKDEITITILPDGTLRSETTPISGPVHSSAESFFADMARLTGGEVSRNRRGHAHNHHVHTHTEEKKA